MSENKHSGRKTPPENDGDWLHIWSGIEKAHDAWLIAGPLVALVKNWKAWAVGAAIYAYMRSPDIVAAIDTLMGVAK